MAEGAMLTQQVRMELIGNNLANQKTPPGHKEMMGYRPVCRMAPICTKYCSGRRGQCTYRQIAGEDVDARGGQCPP